MSEEKPSWFGRLFRNPRPARIAIGAFVVLLIILFLVSAKKAHAEQAIVLEGGSAMLRGETPVLGINWRCLECGPIGTAWEAGFDLIGSSEYYKSNSNVIQLHAQIVPNYKRFGMGIGFFYQNVPTEYVCQFGFHLLARYDISQHFSMQWRHSSSAGSCTPNAGRDLLTVGYRF